MRVCLLRAGNHTVTVRDCVVDSGGLNSDSEIGRETHCWIVSEIKLDDVQMRGCSLACDTSGCNHANTMTHAANTTVVLVFLALCVYILNKVT